MIVRTKLLLEGAQEKDEEQDQGQEREMKNRQRVTYRFRRILPAVVGSSGHRRLAP